MLIDWFTVGAQIVNFLILVWLLKRYLYRPVLAAIDAREKDIASRRDAASAEQEQARKDREECQRQNETLDQRRLASINVAQEEAKAERTRLLEEATCEAENLRLARRKQLEEETMNYREEFSRLTRQEIIAVVRKILSDLASAELEHSAVEVFLRRLGEVPSLENTAISKPGPDGSPAAIRLRSAFALSPAQQETVKNEVQKKFQTSERIEFESAPDLVLGLELIFHDQKIAWNIDDYLSSFEAHLTDFAQKKSPSILS
jgi:F-type H+-transporting ATPase subunit b